MGGWVIVEENSASNGLAAWNIAFTQVENTTDPAFVDRVLGTADVLVDGNVVYANIVCNKLVDTSGPDYVCELQLPNEPVIEVELIHLRNGLATRVYDSLGTTITSEAIGWRLSTSTGRFLLPN